MIQEDDLLTRDLGLDSLALADFGVWLEAEFGFAVPDSVVCRAYATCCWLREAT